MSVPLSFNPTGLYKIDSSPELSILSVEPLNLPNLVGYQPIHKSISSQSGCSCSVSVASSDETNVSTSAGTRAASRANPLDLVSRLLCAETIDAQATLEALALLPAQTQHHTGWWPGTYILANGRCPTCGKKAHELSLKVSIDMVKMRQHTFTCAPTAQRQSFWDECGDMLKDAQATPCPLCLKYGTKNVKGRHVSGHAGPGMWSKHIAEKHGNKTSCSCGSTFTPTLSSRSMHLLMEHDIFVTKSLYSQKTLQPEHLPLAPFSFVDYAFHPDPREWESHCRDAIYPQFSKTTASPARWSEGREHPDSDMRYRAIMTHTNGHVAAAYGYCMICMHDENLTYTKRCVQYLERPLENHFIHHFVGWYNEPACTYSCPNSVCKTHPQEFATLALHEYFLHMVNIHNFARDKDGQSQDVSSCTDSGGLLNCLRAYASKNAVIHLKAALGVPEAVAAAAKKRDRDRAKTKEKAKTREKATPKEKPKPRAKKGKKEE